MTATYPSKQRNGAPESSGSPESIKQIADSALMLRTQLEGDNAVATETVLKTLKRIEGLASTLSLNAIQEAAQSQGEIFKVERDRLFSLIANIRNSLSLEVVFKSAVEEVRELMQVDRAIIYKFDAEFNGLVVAESVLPGYTVSLGMPIIDTCFRESKAAQYATNRIAATDDIHRAGLTPCHVQLLERFEVKANLVVPILQGGQVWGLFILHQCDKTRHWEEFEINLLYQIATQITVAIQQAESFGTAQLKAKTERDRLFEVINNIRKSLDLETIFNTAVNEVQSLLQVDRAVVYQFDAQYNGIVVAEAVELGWTISLGMPITDTCFQKTKAAQYASNRIAATDDIYKSQLTPCHIQLLERFQVKANLVVPILQGEKVWGLFILHQCTGPRHWEESEINLLYQISTQLTVAIQQAETLKQVQTKAKNERDQLLAIVGGIRQSLDLDVIFNATVNGVRQLLEGDRVVIYQFDQQFNGLVVAESMLPGWTPSLGVPITDTCFRESKAVQYASNRISALDDIYHSNLTPCHIQLLERFQVKANLVVPILQGEQVWGLLIVHQCSGTRHWEESDINLLFQIATQLTVAIQQTEMVINAQRQAQVEQDKLTLRDRLFAVIADIRRTLNIETIFQTATRELRTLLSADRVAIYQFDETWGGLFITESIATGWNRLVGTDRARVDDTNLKQSEGGRYRNSEISIVDDIYETGFDPCHIDLLEQFQARAYIIVPIFKEQQLWGLLAAYQNSGPRTWEEFEVDILYQIALQLSVALQQSESLAQSQTQTQQLSEAVQQQQEAKEFIQRRAMELLIEVDPVSRGDLTVRARVTDDELGTVADSYNQTIESLSNIVIQVQEAATQVTDISTASGSSIQNLSEEALRQAEEIGSALEQIQKMAMSTQAVSMSARQAEAEVQQANRTVQSGDAAMNRTVEGILVIRDTVAATAKKIKRLSESSQKISKVVNLISNFAAQTNLLALNASIEAARAGEQGRGFAVVADEVRSLARQSATATAEIEKLVQEIQMETSEVSAAMESGTEQVVKGTQLVNETRQSLNEIAAVADRIKSMVESIAQASTVQTTEAEAATQIIERVAGMANQNSEDALQTLQSFQKLLETAQNLQTSVGQFKVE